MYPETKILGIRLHKISRRDLEKEVVSSLGAPRPLKPLFIATVNPSFVLKAQKDVSFKEILNHKTTLNVADGVGLKIADRSLEIIPGVDIVRLLLDKAELLGSEVHIVSKRDSLTPKGRMEYTLRAKYPKLVFSVKEEDSVVGGCDVLLCALGEVEQEKFIVDNMGRTRSRVAIGIGGAFDVITGAIKLPQTVYFSWFFRLIASPRRFPKIFRSVILFPLLFFSKKLLTRCNKVPIM